MTAIKQCGVSHVPGNTGEHEWVKSGNKGRQREDLVELKKVAV